MIPGVRKGEWWEIRLGKQVPESKDAIAAYLQNELKLPVSWVKKNLYQNIRITGDRLCLRFFSCQAAQFSPEWSDLEVLYEDDFCMVVHKPAGLLVHPADKNQGGTLANAVAAYYEASGQQIAVRHIHRLDEFTSGPVLYAKNELAQSMLDEAMRQKSIERIYIAFIKGTPRQKRDTLALPIGRDRHHSQRRRVSATGDYAVTQYEVLESFHGASLVRLKLQTGRTHQIRVHLSHIGHPLLGDALYGGPMQQIQRQALHGEQLIFTHPYFRETVFVEDPWPEDLRLLADHLKK